MLFGKTVVVTGISSGIGARIGESAAAMGADVIGVDVKDPARPMEAFVRADIGSPQGVAEIVDVLPKRIDALCNVAGVSGVIEGARSARPVAMANNSIADEHHAAPARPKRDWLQQTLGRGFIRAGNCVSPCA